MVRILMENVQKTRRLLFLVQQAYDGGKLGWPLRI